MAKHHCTYCQSLILTCRVRCSECTDFDLCLQCFALGAEAGGHKKEHDYHVLDDGYVNVFENTDPWAAEEEEALLEAVEQYGFGNWEDVSSHVETKTMEVCREHYYTYYIHGNIGKSTFPTEHKQHKVVDHTCPDGDVYFSGPLSPSLTKPTPPVELTLPEQQELGYMPLRDDFEREYDNEAEALVSGLNINYDDEDFDITFKLAKVDMYRQRLKERQRRKIIAREYAVIQCSTTVGQKKQQNSKKKFSKEEKDFQDKMRVFAQFHSHGDHEQFFDNVQKEKQLKLRIKELMRYRRNGITKFDDVSEYEAEKLRREKKKDTKKKLTNLSMAKRASMASKNQERSGGGDQDDTIDDGDMGSGCREHTETNGTNLLSDRERRLCSSIGMKAASYITIKTSIIKDYLQRRQGVPIKIRYPSHLDKTHRRKILNFLSENGWIGGVGVC